MNDIHVCFSTKEMEQDRKWSYIILGPTSWIKAGVKQRPNHVARALADAGQEVVYLAYYPSLKSDIHLREEQIVPYVTANPFTEDGVLIYSPFKVIFEGEVCCDPFNAVLAHILRTVSYQPVIVAYLPRHIMAINSVAGQKVQVIYECVDDHQDAHAYWRDEMDQQWEQELCDRADAITTTATALFIERAVVEKRRNVYLSRNAVNFLDFSFDEMPACPEDLKDIPKPRVFYMGALYSWFDSALLEETARQNPDKSFVFVGMGDESILPTLDNVYYLGCKRHLALKFYCYHMQAGIIPFRDDISLSIHCDAIKQYEYLACGLPVVTTFMPDSAIGKPYSFQANTAKDFTRALDEALTVKPDPDVIVAYLKENSWQERAALLMRIAQGCTLPEEQVECRLDTIREELEPIWQKHPNLEVLYGLACKHRDEAAYQEHVKGAWDKAKSPYISKQYERSIRHEAGIGMNDIHVCFSIDDNYAQYCGVSILSMLEHQKPDERIYVYVIHQRLSEENQKKLQAIASSLGSPVRFVKLSEKEFQHMPLIKGAHFTIETYFRLAIPRLFPDIKKMIYLDSDILIKGSLGELAALDMQGKHVGMVKDVDATEADEGFNAGVLVYDCDLWRQDGIEMVMHEYVRTNIKAIVWVDQSVINHVLKDSIYTLDAKWNDQIHLHQKNEDKDDWAATLVPDSRVIHFASFSKPWHGAVDNALVDEYFGYLKRLPWELADHRERNKGLNPHFYYYYFGLLREMKQEKQVAKDSEVLILHETQIKREMTFAAQDLGMEKVESFLLKSSDWIDKRPDFLILDYHNPAIANHILQPLGYDIASDRRIVMLSEVLQRVPSDILAQEYMDFLKEIEQAQKRSYIILGSTPWSQAGAKQRPHHIARALAAAGQEVVYLAACPGVKSDVRLGEEQIVPYVIANPFTEDGVLIYSPFKSIFEGEVVCDPFYAVLAHILKAVSHPAVIVAYLPKHILAVRSIADPKIKVIYECVDDHQDVQYAYWREEMDFQWEQELFDRADAITTTATSLFLERAVAEKRRNVYLSRNAVHFLDFYIDEMPACPQDLQNIPKPRIFYMGSLYSRFDSALFEETARQNPDKSFVIVGMGDENVLPALDNVYFLGSKPHHELKNYLYHMQAGIIPFLDHISLSMHCDSIKQHEYLACGLPVVTTFMPDAAIEKPYSFQANTAKDFTKALGEALAVKPDPDVIVAYLKENSWQERAALLMRIAQGCTLPEEQVECRLDTIREALEPIWQKHPNLEVLYGLACKHRDEAAYQKHVKGAWDKAKSLYIRQQYERL